MSPCTNLYLRRDQYAYRFGLSRRMKINMMLKFVDQLDRCADDEARRILLGVTIKETA
jgi:hypothetical protein